VQVAVAARFVTGGDDFAYEPRLLLGDCAQHKERCPDLQSPQQIQYPVGILHNAAGELWPHIWRDSVGKGLDVIVVLDVYTKAVCKR
jgi:hypothetical protein